MADHCVAAFHKSIVAFRREKRLAAAEKRAPNTSALAQAVRLFLASRYPAEATQQVVSDLLFALENDSPGEPVLAALLPFEGWLVFLCPYCKQLGSVQLKLRLLHWLTAYRDDLVISDFVYDYLYGEDPEVAHTAQQALWFVDPEDDEALEPEDKTLFHLQLEDFT